MQTESRLPGLGLSILPEKDLPRLLAMGLTIIVATAMLFASAKIQVPFYPVPMTLQTLVVLLLGIVLGPVLGTACVIAYLAQGALGYPVFAGTPEKGLGLAYMTGPTGGYLLGFVLAAFVSGHVAQRFPQMVGITLAVIAGIVCIYTPGLIWLAGFIGAEKALQFGLYPFALAEAVKMGLAILLAFALIRRVNG